MTKLDSKIVKVTISMNEQKKRIGIFLCAALLSAALSVAVFAVAGYDSSAAPLISQSYLIKYIQENVITPQDARYNALLDKITAIEKTLDALLNNYTPPSDSETGSSDETTSPDTGTTLPGYTENPETLESISRLANRLTELETLLETLSAQNTALSGRQDSLEKENAAIKEEISKLKQQISDFIEENSKEDIDLLKEKYNALQAEIKALKSSTSSIQASFTDISKSYVALQKEVYNLNLTLKELSDSDSSVLADLLSLSSKVTEMGNALTKLATENMTFEMVKLEMGDRIVANGSVSVMLQYGVAQAVSPASEYGTSMEFTDLTSGELIKDGDALPLNHNVFIPGNGRTAILCTGEHGIYIFVGGDYTVVKASAEAPNE